MATTAQPTPVVASAVVVVPVKGQGVVLGGGGNGTFRRTILGDRRVDPACSCPCCANLPNCLLSLCCPWFMIARIKTRNKLASIPEGAGFWATVAFSFLFFLLYELSTPRFDAECSCMKAYTGYWADFCRPVAMLMSILITYTVRREYRRKYSIVSNEGCNCGVISDDCCCSIFCSCCVLIQMANTDAPNETCGCHLCSTPPVVGAEARSVV